MEAQDTTRIKWCFTVVCGVLHSTKWTPRFCGQCSDNSICRLTRLSCSLGAKITALHLEAHWLLFGRGALGGPGPSLAALWVPRLFDCTRRPETSTGRHLASSYLSFSMFSFLFCCAPASSLICSLLLFCCAVCPLFVSCCLSSFRVPRGHLSL